MNDSTRQLKVLQAIGLPNTENVNPARFPDETFELYSVPSFSEARPEVLRGAKIKSSKQAVQPGDVLLCKIIPHLVRVWCVPPARDHRQIASGEWIVVRPKPGEVERDYLRYALIEPRFRAAFMDTVSGVGGSLMRARPKAVAQIPIPVPPLDEQRHIVRKLDRLFVCSQTAHTELARIPRLIERYKQAVLDAAFRGDLTAEWRIEQGLPEPTLATVDTLVAVPIRNGLSVRGSDEPPGIRSLRLSALRSGVVNLEDVRFLPITASRAEKFLLSNDDVLVSRGNGTKTFVGIAALVHELRKPTIFPDTSFRIRLAIDRARPDWFTSMWNAPQVRLQIEAAARTTAGIWKVSQSDLARIELSLPDPREQAEIAARIKVAFGCIDQIAAETVRATRVLDRLDQAILAKAFRGELISSIKDLSDGQGTRQLASNSSKRSLTVAK